MNIPRILLAAPKSGSGKTLITCGMLQYFKENSESPIAFKCGPDYIDPMFHKKVIGIPSQNLDSYFLDKQELRKLFVRQCERQQTSIAIIEGVMGLYDGLGGTSKEASAYDVASILETPVILVIDAHGMGRSVIALIAGFLQYDKNKLIKGVILNQTTKGFYEMIKPVIEWELPISVIGYVPKIADANLESRHLGLKMPEEIANIQEQLIKVAKTLSETIDIEKFLEIANDANMIKENEVIETLNKNDNNVRIAVAKDEAFCFYYDQNLKLLEKYGAKIVYFSPLHDKKLPDNISGIVLGGGYPELVAKELSENKSMMESIKHAIVDLNIPSIAECGGFMYLHDKLIDENGCSYQMAGVVPAEVRYTGKLVRFGYIKLQEKLPVFMPKDSFIKGHEFHYYDSSSNGDNCVAKKPTSSRQWECVHSSSNHFWGFPHLYYLSQPEFIKHFIQEARKYK